MAVVTAITVMLVHASLYSCRTLRPVSLIHDGSSEVTLVSSGRLTTKLAQMIPILEGLDSSDSKITKIKKLIPVYDKLKKWRINNEKAFMEIMPSVKKRKPLAFILSDGGNALKNAAAAFVNNDNNSATGFEPNHTTYQSTNKNSHSKAKHTSPHETKHKSSHENHSDHDIGKQSHGLMENCKQNPLLCIEEGLNTERNDKTRNDNIKQQTLNKDAAKMKYGLKGNYIYDDFDVIAEVPDKSHDIDTPDKNIMDSKLNLLENDLKDDIDFDSSFDTNLAIVAEVSDESNAGDIESHSKNTFNRRSLNKFNLLTQKDAADTAFDLEIPELEELNRKHQHHSNHNKSDDQHAEHHHSTHTNKHGSANKDNTAYYNNNNDHPKNEHNHIKYTLNDKPIHEHSKENSHDLELENVNSKFNNANAYKSYVSNDVINTQNWQSEEIPETQHYQRHSGQTLWPSHYVSEIQHSSHNTSPHIEHSSHKIHAKKQLSESHEEYENFADSSIQEHRDNINAKSVELPTYESASNENINFVSASSQSDPVSNDSDLNFDSESSLSDSEFNESSLSRSSDSESNEFYPKLSSLDDSSELNFDASNESGSNLSSSDSVSSEIDSILKLSDSGSSEFESESSSLDSESNKSDSESGSLNYELIESDSELSSSNSDSIESDSESGYLNSESNESDVISNVTKSDSESTLNNSASDTSESESEVDTSDAELASSISDSESTESDSNEYNSAENSPKSRTKSLNSDNASSYLEVHSNHMSLSSENSHESDFMYYPTSLESRSIESNSLSSETSEESSELNSVPSESNAEISESFSKSSDTNNHGSISKPKYFYDSVESSLESLYSDISPEFFLEPSSITESSFNPALKLSEIYPNELESSKEQELNESDIQSLTSDFGSVITKFGTRKFYSKPDFDNGPGVDDLSRKPISSVAVTKTKTTSRKACNSVNRANQNSKQLGSKARRKSYKLSFIFYR